FSATLPKRYRGVNLGRLRRKVAEANLEGAGFIDPPPWVGEEVRRRASIGVARRSPGVPSGTVKFFNTTKGYGFVRPADGTNDVFVHVSELTRSGIANLNGGNRVAFDIETDPKTGRPRAMNIRVES